MSVHMSMHASIPMSIHMSIHMSNHVPISLCVVRMLEALLSAYGELTGCYVDTPRWVRACAHMRACMRACVYACTCVRMQRLRVGGVCDGVGEPRCFAIVRLGAAGPDAAVRTRGRTGRERAESAHVPVRMPMHTSMYR